jgi:hypothetical protein
MQLVGVQVGLLRPLQVGDRQVMNRFRKRAAHGPNFKAKLVPPVVEVMMDHPGTLWGQGTYPVVK